MRKAGVVLLMVGLLTLGLPAGAQAARAFVTNFALNGLEGREAPFEDACGVALDSSGDLYVSEYYRDQVDVYNSALSLVVKITRIDPFDGPCALAVDSSGRVYVNDYHRGVLRYAPSSYPPQKSTTYGPAETLDSHESTGIALAPATGDLYVDDRTYIAKYEAPISPGDEPVQKIGLGTLGDGYGLARSTFSATRGELYVPDASSNAVKVFDPAIDLVKPAEEIDGAGTPQGRFDSLVDSVAAIDPTNGNVLVADDTQPGFEHPAAAIDEFDSVGEYLGQLSHAVTNAEPPGITISENGHPYVTSGNGAGSALYAFGAFSSFAPLSTPQGGGGQSAGGAVASIQGLSSPSASARPGDPVASTSETKQQGTLRASFQGRLSPRALPRTGRAPVHASVATKIATTNGSNPPQLRQIQIAINANGHFEPKGLPICAPEEIQPASTQAALSACRSSLVGEGLFEAKVLLSQQSPFPSQGKVYAFNSTIEGHPAILAHVYGTKPVPTSFTLPFVLHRSKGTFGTTLVASLPEVTGNSAYVTGISLNLFRRFTYKGRQRSYISAGCPAPKGLPGATFPFARASLSFKGGKRMSQTLVRSCGVAR